MCARNKHKHTLDVTYHKCADVESGVHLLYICCNCAVSLICSARPLPYAAVRARTLPQCNITHPATALVAGRIHTTHVCALYTYPLIPCRCTPPLFSAALFHTPQAEHRDYAEPDRIISCRIQELPLPRTAHLDSIRSNGTHYFDGRAPVLRPTSTWRVRANKNNKHTNTYDYGESINQMLVVDVTAKL